MTFDIALLAGAASALAGAIAALWRTLLAERRAGDADRREASRLIFALLQQRANITGVCAPKTTSTPEEPHFLEAKQLANEALNGELESLVRAYLASDPPPTPRSPR